jgi:hypothetical protein
LYAHHRNILYVVLWIKEIELIILKEILLLRREAVTFDINLGMLGKSVLLPFFTVRK